MPCEWQHIFIVAVCDENFFVGYTPHQLEIFAGNLQATNIIFGWQCRV